MNPAVVPGFLPAPKAKHASHTAPQGGKTSFGEALGTPHAKRPNAGEKQPAHDDSLLARLAARLAEVMEQDGSKAVEPGTLPEPDTDSADKHAAERDDVDDGQPDDEGLLTLLPLTVAELRRRALARGAEGEARDDTAPVQADRSREASAGDKAAGGDKPSGADAKTLIVPTAKTGIELHAAAETEPSVSRNGSVAVLGVRVATVADDPISGPGGIAAFFAGQRIQGWLNANNETKAGEPADGDATVLPLVADETAVAVDPQAPVVEADAASSATPKRPEVEKEPSDQPEGRATERSRVEAVAARSADLAGPSPRLADTAANLAATVVDDLVASGHASKTAAIGQPTAMVVSTQPQTLKIQLHPVELGMVTATLRMAGDQITVEIATEKLEAYERLNVDSDAIVKSLRGLGLQVDQLTVQPPQSATTGAARPEADAAMQNAPGGREQQSAQTGNMGGGERNGRAGRSFEGGSPDASHRNTGAAAAADSHDRGLVI